MSIGWRFLYACLLASLSSSCFAGSNPAVPANVILITLDTARADRMGFLGAQFGLTPNLDSLARQSAVFSRAYAHVPLTTPSHATILTGTYPQFNHLGDLGTPLVRDLPYLPDLLRQHGYRTAAFVGSQVLDPKSAAAPGFDRGFDTYDAGFHSRRNGEDRYTSEERRAHNVVDHALIWLGRRSRSPFFLWVHLYDPHDPYDPPEPFKTKYAAAPYDGEIAYTDSALGKLFAALRSQGLYEGAVIAVVADHGEAFGEHGEESHGFFLYDETVHVPLLIKLPGNRANLRITTRVGLVDVAPTLLTVAGVQAPAAMQGASLLGLLQTPRRSELTAESSRLPERPAYSETDYPHRAFGWSSLRALRAGKYLYIDAPRRELYNQESDPKALHNLAATSTAVADTMQAQLEEFRSKSSSKTATIPATVSPDQAEQLQALGYVTAASISLTAGKEERAADPKDKIEIANLLHHALLAVDSERYRDAVPQLQRVLKEEPGLALANLEMGRALNGSGKYEQALPWLRKALELNPESGRAHYEMGVALGETGDWAGSAQQLEAALVHAPDSDDLYFYLGMAYDAVGNAAEAARNFREALRINPAHYRANLLLGRLLGMENNPMGALPYLEQAVKLQPQSPDAHKFLANVYIELGQSVNARREQAEADRLSTSAKP